MTLLSNKNKIFAHFLQYQYLYTLLFFLILLLLPLLTIMVTKHPLPLGGESYYHLSRLSAAEQPGLVPWYWLLQLPGASFFLSPLLGLGFLLFFFLLSRQLGCERRLAFLFIMLLLISPPFLWSFTAISAYGYVAFLLLTGFFFLVQRKDWLALLPFTLASFLDLFSNLLVLLVVGFYWYRQRRQSYAFTGALVVMALLNWLLLRAPFFLGPFHAQNFWRDLITDFGGQGMGFFLLILAVIGLVVTWKQREFLSLYAFLPVVMAGYFLNTETIFLLTLLATVFAAVGVTALFERPWKRKIFQQCTLLIIVLGLLFSLLSYLDRLPESGPVAAEREALTWMRENTPESTIVLSSPDNGYFIQYLAQRTPFLQHHQGEQLPAGQEIFSSTYITGLFPLLGQYNISVIYITPALRSALPAEQGFLFLLKNERFKLVYVQEGYEVWLFSREEEK